MPVRRRPSGRPRVAEIMALLWLIVLVKATSVRRLPDRTDAGPPEGQIRFPAGCRDNSLMAGKELLRVANAIAGLGAGEALTERIGAI